MFIKCWSFCYHNESSRYTHLLSKNAVCAKLVLTGYKLPAIFYATGKSGPLSTTFPYITFLFLVTKTNTSVKKQPVISIQKGCRLIVSSLLKMLLKCWRKLQEGHGRLSGTGRNNTGFYTRHLMPEVGTKVFFLLAPKFPTRQSFLCTCSNKCSS